MNAEHAEHGRPRPSRKLLQEEVTGQILRAYVEVQRELKPGFLESVYSGAFGFLLQEYGLSARAEFPIDVRFRGRVVGIFRADYLVEDSVIVELKAVARLDGSHTAQLANYLRATEMEVGILLNFGRFGDFHRVVWQTGREAFRDLPRSSA